MAQHQPPREARGIDLNRTRVVCVLLAAILLPSTSLAAEIQHEPITCWPRDAFPVARAGFQPRSDIMMAKLYFRAEHEVDFHFVEMALDAQGNGRAVLPQTLEGTAGVTYFIEWVTLGYAAYRTDERNVPVADISECRQRGGPPPVFTGQEPNIAVGSTRAGASQIPGGFGANGITQFISPTGGPEKKSRFPREMGMVGPHLCQLGGAGPRGADSPGIVSAFRCCSWTSFLISA